MALELADPFEPGVVDADGPCAADVVARARCLLEQQRGGLPMIGELTRDEIEQLLRRETVGRIGCSAEGRIYIVPITYAYDGDCVYAHSADGLKIRTMRANPSVCFEVEHLIDLAHWSCVVAWGTYEELSGHDEERASALILSRFGSTPTSATALRHPRVHGIAQEASRTTLFRLRLSEKTGRFER